jgi:hypothetical protein
MHGRSGTWIAEEKARGSGIAELARSGRRSDPGLRESENVDAASFSKISNSSIFERVKKRANVECTYIEGSGKRPGVEVMGEK